MSRYETEEDGSMGVEVGTQDANMYSESRVKEQLLTLKELGYSGDSFICTIEFRHPTKNLTVFKSEHVTLDRSGNLTSIKLL